MSFYDHWQSQKDELRAALRDQSDMAGVAYQIRHALLQAEQDTLAEMKDEVLRQQAGVLIDELKGATAFLEVEPEQKVWVLQQAGNRQNNPKSERFRRIAFAVLLGVGIIAYFKHAWVLLAGVAAAAVFLLIAFLTALKIQKNAGTPESDIRVSLKPNMDKLFSALDKQVRAIDRALTDFSYLNGTLCSEADRVDLSTVNRAAELTSALYECGPEERELLEGPAEQLLESIGLRSVPYSENNQKLFSVLPSKNQTVTVSPAILSVKDERLLKRGTAAVKQKEMPERSE